MRWTRATIQTPRPAAPPSPRTGKVAAQRPDEVSKVRNPYLIPGQIRTAPLPPPPGGLKGSPANPRHLPQHSRSADHWSAAVLSASITHPGRIRTQASPHVILSGAKRSRRIFPFPFTLRSFRSALSRLIPQGRPLAVSPAALHRPPPQGPTPPAALRHMSRPLCFYPVSPSLPRKSSRPRRSQVFTVFSGFWSMTANSRIP